MSLVLLYFWVFFADILFDIFIFGRGENNGKRNFPSVPQGPFIDQKVEITDKK